MQAKHFVARYRTRYFGSSGHLFWNQSGNYYKVKVVWDRLDEAAEAEDDVGEVSSR